MSPRPCPILPSCRRSVTALLALALATGCGGGTTAPGGGAPPVLASGAGPGGPPQEDERAAWIAIDPGQTEARLAAAFADGSGVFRIRDGGLAYTVLSSDAAGFVPGGTGAPVDPATVVVLNATDRLTVHRGSFVDDAGRGHVATLWRRSVAGPIAGCGTGCEVVLIGHIVRADDGTLTLQTAGALPRDLPRGSFVFEGVHLAGFAGGGFQDGTFRMVADFTSATATLEASTQDLRLAGGGIRIDMRSGEFAGESLTLTGLHEGATNATVRGSFHGSGATGVSGIWTENAPAPDAFGAIAGSRR